MSVVRRKKVKGGRTQCPAQKPATSVARSLAEKLLKKHREAGLPDVENPGFKEFPKVPEDITGIHDQDLSALYGRLDAFAGYISAKLSAAEVEFLEVSVSLKELEAKLALEALIDAKKGEATKRKYEAFLDDQAVELRKSETYHKAEVKLLKGRLEAVERSIRILSREQSRREKVYDRRRTT